MRSRLAASACAAALLAASGSPLPLAAAQEAAPPPVQPVRGVCVPLHSTDPDFDYGPALAEVRALGASHACVFVHLYQRDAASARPARHPLRTASDSTLVRTLRAGRALGLEVAVMPSLLLEAPAPDDWKGNIHPPDWTAWFEGYRREVLHYARLAEEGGATLFSVGSELSSTEERREDWRAVIRAVRAVFPGDLTYSANWDHYRGVQVWSELDYIGLSGYYELAARPDPTAEELAASWAAVRDRLVAWRATQGYSAPLLFLEVGYASQDGCASHPWDYTRGGCVDLEEQRRCYEAFVEAWRGVPDLGGAFFYEWWGDGGPGDTSYTPRGKPAQDVLRRWFGGS